MRPHVASLMVLSPDELRLNKPLPIPAEESTASPNRPAMSNSAAGRVANHAVYKPPTFDASEPRHHQQQAPASIEPHSEQRTSCIHDAEKGTPATRPPWREKAARIAPAPQRRMHGLRLKVFLIVLAVVLLIIIAATVGGSLAAAKTRR